MLYRIGSERGSSVSLDKVMGRLYSMEYIFSQTSEQGSIFASADSKLPLYTKELAVYPKHDTSFVALVVQNVCLVLQVRTSRLRSSGYDPAIVVLVTEFAKLLLNASLELISNRPSRSTTASRNLMHSCLDRRDVFRMTFPALLYVVQNNLLYVALANLPVPLYQVTNQGKIAATAFFGYWFFGRRLSLQRIVALFLLGSGIALAQLAEAEAKTTTISVVMNTTTRVSNDANTTTAGITGSSPTIGGPHLAPSQNQLVGLAAMAICSITSGIAGVYFEWMLKKDNLSNPKLPQTKQASSDPSSGPVMKTEYVRNVQLAVPSICLSASALFFRRFVYRSTAGTEGFFTDLIRWSGELLRTKLLAVSL